MSLSYKEVAEILKIIDASSMDEVVLELDDARLVVRRGAASQSSTISTPDVKSIPTATKAKTQVKQALVNDSVGHFIVVHSQSRE